MASYTESLDDKKHCCNECGKGYSSKRGLDRHVKIHNGKLHFCKICNKGFTDAFDLKRHTATHKGALSEALADLKYSCDLCDVSFVNKRLLSVHTRNDHFEKEPLVKSHKRSVRRLEKAIVEDKKDYSYMETSSKDDRAMEMKKEVVLQEATFLLPQDEDESPKEAVVEKDFSQHFDALLWNYSSLTDIIEGPSDAVPNYGHSGQHVQDGDCCFLCSTIQSGCQLEISFSL